MNSTLTKTFLVIAGFMLGFLLFASLTQASMTPKATINYPVILRDSPSSIYMLLDFDISEELPAGADDRPPLAVSLVVDRSGSMEGQNKLEYAKQAANDIVERLSPGDSLAVVEYDNIVTVAHPLASVKKKTNFKDVIDALEPRGGTNLAGGMMEGVKQLADNRLDQSSVRRVILLSDGLANQGVTSPMRIASMAAEARSRGVHVTAMGLGLEYNEDLMQSVAESGGGSYYFIESPTQIASIFQEEVDQLFKTVTKDVKLTMTLGDHVRDVQVYGYPAKRDGKVVFISLNDFYAGEKRAVLVRLDLDPVHTKALRFGAVNISYQDLVAGEDRCLTLPMEVITTADSREVAANEDARTSIEAMLITADQDHDESVRLYETGDVENARQRMEELTARVAEANRHYDDVQLGKKLEALRMEKQELERSERDATYRKDYLKRNKEAFYRAKKGQRSKYMLMEGANSADVVRLQKALKDKGAYGGPVDGEYTNDLMEAVKGYQAENRIQADGVAGPKTLRALGLY